MSPKDNPLQQLDLLEVQLARVKSDNEYQGKLARTKYLLERLEKSGKLNKNAEQLQTEIDTLKRDLINRKIHHTQTIIKRIIKQFTKLELLKITKRLKTADDAKKPMLESEMELIKSDNHDNWAEEIMYRALSKNFTISKVTGREFEKRTLSQPEINVFARLGKLDAIKEANDALAKNVAQYYEVENGNAVSAAASASTSSAKTQASSKPEQPKKPVKDDFTNFEDEKVEEEDEDSEEENDGQSNAVDPFFATTAQYDISDDEDDNDEARGGLPLLTQGFISGSEDEGDFDAIEPEAPLPRKNRRGQRARRKIWEQKFGARANHILKEEREKQKQKEEKENKKRRREEQEQRAKKQKLEFMKKPVHPSWEAHQKLKEKQEQVKFAGKKMKFD